MMQNQTENLHLLPNCMNCQLMKQVPIITLLSFIFLFHTSTIMAQKDKQHVKVVAKSGDGIYSILSKYQIPLNKCNVDYFCKSNKITLNSNLKIGKTYQLPIFIYRYNGESIRSTLSDDDWDKALRIQEYNRAVNKAGLKKGNYEKDLILWVPYYEEFCKAKPPITVRPKKATVREFGIFGEQHKKVLIKSNKLKNCVYYIVGGHGGPDPGAVGKKDGKQLCEDEYAYDIALRLARNLLAHGATVYVITRDKNDGIRDSKYLKCDTDETCWKNQTIPRNQKRRLEQRSSSINEIAGRLELVGKKYQRAIMIHIDSQSKDMRQDMFFYYFPGTQAGKSLANTLRSTIERKYDVYQKNRGYTGTVSGRDLHMLRETKPPSVYIELGNIANPQDQNRFIVVNNRQAVADWLYDGFVKDYQNWRERQ